MRLSGTFRNFWFSWHRFPLPSKDLLCDVYSSKPFPKMFRCIQITLTWIFRSRLCVRLDVARMIHFHVSAVLKKSEVRSSSPQEFFDVDMIQCTIMFLSSTTPYLWFCTACHTRFLAETCGNGIESIFHQVLLSSQCRRDVCDQSASMQTFHWGHVWVVPNIGRSERPSCATRSSLSRSCYFFVQIFCFSKAMYGYSCRVQPCAVALKRMFTRSFIFFAVPGTSRFGNVSLERTETTLLTDFNIFDEMFSVCSSSLGHWRACGSRFSKTSRHKCSPTLGVTFLSYRSAVCCECLLSSSWTSVTTAVWEEGKWSISIFCESGICHNTDNDSYCDVVNIPFVKISASRPLDLTIFDSDGRVQVDTLSNNQSTSTLWNLVTCRIVGLRPSGSFRIATV